MNHHIDYADMVQSLAKSGEDICAQMTPRKAHALHMSVGVSGEAGELIDAVKRWSIYGQEVDRDNVIEELGDLEFFMEGLRQGLNITRDECLTANISKLGKRYAAGKYSDQQARDRADKEQS